MKYVKLFEEKIPKSYISKDQEFSYKETTLATSTKPTWILKVGPSIWKEVEHLFADKSNDLKYRTKKTSVSSSTVWNLYDQKYKSDGKEMRKIYGVSGSYTFGGAPTFYSKTYAGNKIAAKDVYDQFIDEHIIPIVLLDKWLESGLTLEEFKHEKRGFLTSKKFGF